MRCKDGRLRPTGDVAQFVITIFPLTFSAATVGGAFVFPPLLSDLFGLKTPVPPRAKAASRVFACTENESGHHVMASKHPARHSNAGVGVRGATCVFHSWKEFDLWDAPLNLPPPKKMAVWFGFP
jgi:hypothetical protein